MSDQKKENQPQIGSRIDDLIQETTDPQVKGTLLILSRIDNSLTSNTRATEAIAGRLESHITEFQTHIQDFRAHTMDVDKLISKLMGAWWAGIAFFSIIVTLGGYIVTQYVRSNEVQDVHIEALERRLSLIEARIGMLIEHNMKAPTP